VNKTRALPEADGPAGAYHWCMTQPIRLILELAPDVEPPRGSLIDETGAERPFSGWMQLSSALADACERAHAEPSAMNAPSPR
jgi:hypothetical protein